MYRKLTNEPDKYALFLHPIYGARTLANIAELEALKPVVRKQNSKPVEWNSIKRENLNERSIDEFGMSLCLD